MAAPAVLPATVTFPPGVTHLRSGQVARLLGVQPRRVAHWQTNGLITASVVTSGGHRRFTAADVQTFLREACPAAALEPRDIVSCRAWNDGRPVRIAVVTPTRRWGVYVRWQDVAAHQHAMDVLVARTLWVRCLSHGHARAA